MALCGRTRWRKLAKLVVSLLCVSVLLMLIMKRFGDFEDSSYSMQKHAMKNVHVPFQPEANYKTLPTLKEDKAKEATSLQDILPNPEKSQIVKMEVSEKAYKEDEKSPEENEEEAEQKNTSEQQPTISKEEMATEKEVTANKEDASVKMYEVIEKMDASKQREVARKDTEAALQNKATEESKEGPGYEKSPELKGETLKQKKEALSKEKDPEQKAEAPSKKETVEQKNEAPGQKYEDPLKEEAVPAKTDATEQMEAQEKEKETSAKEEATEQNEATAKETEVSTKKEATHQKQEAAEKVKEMSSKEVITKETGDTANEKVAPTNKEDTHEKQVAPEKEKEASAKEEATKQKDAAAQKEAPEKKKTENKKRLPPDLNALDLVNFLGDVYAQQENPFLTKGCPSSIRNKVNNTEFGKIFLDKIPILQWAPHATPEEYNRVRQYSGCFGWNFTSWDLLKTTMDLLNSSANGYMFSDWNRGSDFRSSCIRCAVVGNGGILNGSKMGYEIDQHEYVFRVNGAILKGHEDDVGNRTSFYFFSTNSMMNSLIGYGKDGFKALPQAKETSYAFLPDHDRDYYLAKAALSGNAVEGGPNKNKQPAKYFGENCTKEQFKMLHPDFMRYLRNRFLPTTPSRMGFHSIYRPSTGASMLLTALHACDEVDAYGFLTPDYENYADHYYDKEKTKVHFYSNHDYMKEMALWQKLNKQGLIKLYTRS